MCVPSTPWDPLSQLPCHLDHLSLEWDGLCLEVESAREGLAELGVRGGIPQAWAGRDGGEAGCRQLGDGEGADDEE